jgi:hypothetical protein
MVVIVEFTRTCLGDDIAMLALRTSANKSLPGLRRRVCERLEF